MALRLQALLLSIALCLTASGAVHSHEATQTGTPTTTSPYEASSIWTFAAGNYSVTFCAVSEDAVAGGGMVFELLALASTAESDVNATAAHADALFSTFSSDEVRRESVKSGKMLVIKSLNASSSSANVLYRVEFSFAQKCVDATLPVASADSLLVLFTEHGSDEVSVQVRDSNAQVVAALKCISGCEEDNLEAAADSSTSAETTSSSWFGPIVASLVISLTSFVGVIILGLNKKRIDAVVEYMTSFAAGCLLGVVVFHLYPEGAEYLSDLGEWVVGVWVLGGITFSMAVESGVHMILSAFGADHHHAHGGHSHGEGGHHHSLLQDDPEKGLTGSSAESSYVSHPTTPSHATAAAAVNEAKLQPKSFSEKYVKSLKFVEPVAWITAVGDFFHAFTDGVVLAVAFKSCSSALGWAVALGVVLHEVPHRVGDFFIYIKAGMTVPQALVVNFFASLASLFGAVILLAAGSVSDHALGYLMGFGCGALMFIGLSVLLPPMLAVRERRRAAIHFIWFSLGCILIGLSVLQDKHCDSVSGTEHSH
ncbi:Zinc-iron permease [Globisporangium polare]